MEGGANFSGVNNDVGEGTSPVVADHSGYRVLALNVLASPQHTLVQLQKYNSEKLCTTAAAGSRGKSYRGGQLPWKNTANLRGWPINLPWKNTANYCGRRVPQ